MTFEDFIVLAYHVDSHFQYRKMLMVKLVVMFRSRCRRVSRLRGYETENVLQWLICFQIFLIVEGIEPCNYEAARILPLFLHGSVETFFYSLPDDIRNNFLDTEKALHSRFLSSDV